MLFLEEEKINSALFNLCIVGGFGIPKSSQSRESCYWSKAFYLGPIIIYCRKTIARGRFNFFTLKCCRIYAIITASYL